MTLFSIVLLGLAMATDAFAAALGKGAGMVRPRWSEALRIGLIFGVVEALTPVIGWMLGSAAARYIEAWDHWIAFGLLVGLGLHMIYKASGSSADDDAISGSTNGSLLAVALAGFATSIDAMAVGVGLAFVEVNIVLVAVVIGLCTFTLVTVGVMAGRVLGTLIGKRAEIAGGLVLVAVGTLILNSHISAANADADAGAGSGAAMSLPFVTGI